MRIEIYYRRWNIYKLYKDYIPSGLCHYLQNGYMWV